MVGGQAFDAKGRKGCSDSRIKAVLTLRGAGASGARFFRLPVVFTLVTGLLQVVLQLLLRVPPALSYGSHLLRAGCRVRMLVGAGVARSSFACITHTCIVPLGANFRKGAAVRFTVPIPPNKKCTENAL